MDSSSDDETTLPKGIRDKNPDSAKKPPSKKALRGNLNISSLSNPRNKKTVNDVIGGDKETNSNDDVAYNIKGLPQDINLSNPVVVESQGLEYNLTQSSDHHMEMTDVFGDNSSLGVDMHSSSIAGHNPRYDPKEQYQFFSSTPPPPSSSSPEMISRPNLQDNESFSQGIDRLVTEISSKNDLRVGLMKLSNQMETVRYVFARCCYVFANICYGLAMCCYVFDMFLL